MYQATEILLLAALAAFLLFRLRGVLGTRTGHEKPSEYFDSGQPSKKDADQRASKQDAAEIIPIKPRKGQKSLWKSYLEEASDELIERLNRIVAIDGEYSAGEFLEGAGSAYQIITKAFSAGDRVTLRGLLSDEVYGSFETAIEAREESGLEVERKIETLNAAKIVNVEISEASKDSVEVEISVRFKAAVISVARNQQGEIVEGSPENTQQEEALWTFSRKLNDPDPTWVLVATE